MTRFRDRRRVSPRGIPAKRMRSFLLLVAGVPALGFAAPPAVRAEERAPVIPPGAWELGLTGSLTSVEGDTRWSLGIDGAAYRPLGSGFLAPGAELAYAHQNALDLLDLGAGIVWLHRWGRSSAYPYLGPGVGLRQEWIGSFRTARYPVGFDLGLRVPVSESALVRLEYRFRRILGDPVADFTEHRIGMGIALLFGPPPPAETGPGER